MYVAVNIRLYEYGHKQVKIGKKRWYNKEFFIENTYVNRKLKKGVVIPCHITCDINHKRSKEKHAFMLQSILQHNIYYTQI
jgi:hypothetical protein